MKNEEEKFYDDMDKVDEIIWEEVFPILDRIDSDFPEQSAFYNVFVNALHMMFAQGWDKADILEEVEEHHALFLENAKNEMSLH